MELPGYITVEDEQNVCRALAGAEQDSLGSSDRHDQ
jgi:hypothetical protein